MKEFDNLDKRMALLEQKLDLVLDNHLHHMKKDMAMIKKNVGGVAIVVFGQMLVIVITMSI